jgi:hypothetical protein
MSIISKDSIIVKQFNNAKRMNLDALKAQAVKVNEDTLVEINRQQMLGSRSGNGLLPEYSPLSLELKDFSNYKGIFPHFNLYSTGSFQDKMYSSIQGSKFIVSSRDSKTGKLVSMLGEEIFEFDKSSLEQVRMVVTIDYNKLVHDKLNS